MKRRIRYDSEDEASRGLAAADPVMAQLIDQVGRVEFGPVVGGSFEVLVRGIVGQQLSGASANAIFERLRATVGLTARKLAAASEEDLRAAGLSWRKASYVRGIAQDVISGRLDLDRLRRLDDEDVISELSKVRGIGRWTAQMYLLFELGRPDVLATGDMGVRASAGVVLGLERPATEEELKAVGERWRPYRSAATLYLWRQGRTGFGECRPARRERAARV